MFRCFNLWGYISVIRGHSLRMWGHRFVHVLFYGVTPRGFHRNRALKKKCILLEHLPLNGSRKNIPQLCLHWLMRSQCTKVTKNKVCFILFSKYQCNCTSLEFTIFIKWRLLRFDDHCLDKQPFPINCLWWSFSCTKIWLKCERIWKEDFPFMPERF